MNRQVRLPISIQVQFPQRHTAFDWLLEDPRRHRPPMPLHFPRQSDVHGDNLHSLLVLNPYPTCSMPLLTRNTCPSGCRKCISRTFHGMLVGGKVTSSPPATHSLWTASTSSTHNDIQTPLSPVWSS